MKKKMPAAVWILVALVLGIIVGYMIFVSYPDKKTAAQIAGSSGSNSPREKAMPSVYSRQYASTRAARCSSVSEGCRAALRENVS